ncbi:hypothetical protein ACFVOK_14245 [Streptomyces sp. NPDC057798]|uniref:hypothetical protein n=1 Tax=Streptomyces sp. NPDC057798 TaxID=3346252 RepID=UPI0036CBBC27
MTSRPSVPPLPRLVPALDERILHGCPDTPAGVAYLFPGDPPAGACTEVRVPSDRSRPAREVWETHAELFVDGHRLAEVAQAPATTATPLDRARWRAARTLTEWAQPVATLSTLAHLRVLCAVGLRPDAVLGCGFGAVEALHAAGVFDETTLVRLAARYAAQHPPTPAAARRMLAVSGPEQRLARLTALPGRHKFRTVDTYDDGRGLLVAGNHAALEAAEYYGRALGLEAHRAGEAGGGGHLAGGRPAALLSGPGDFLHDLESLPFERPSIPVYATPGPVHLAPAATFHRRFTARLPRRPADAVEEMYAAGLRVFVEAGPGDTLTRIVREQLRDRSHLALSLSTGTGTGTRDAESLPTVLARLAAARAGVVAGTS